jgi:hypothetical protein
MDQIIPARFLKATERVGFGDNLFRDWRYNNDDSPKSDFVLNNQPMVEKSLLEEETLALDLQENMLLGLFMIMVSDVWCLAFRRYI